MRAGTAVWLLVWALVLSAPVPGCGGGDEDTVPVEETPSPPAEPTVSEAVPVVPSDGLPPDLPLQPANNNLDVILHDGRVFLAFRTAPNHFASDRTVIHVVSSEDQWTWTHEASFAMGTDLREPRLLSWDGRLFLYFAVLGANPIDFQPAGMMVTEFFGPGAWTEPERCYLDGFIGWRTKVVADVPYLLGYIGGGSIYDLDPDPIEVHWLTTQDGRNWVPVVPGQPVVLLGGGSETDFVFLDDGSLVAVSRNELGDESGYGTKVCRAAPESPGAWDCVTDPRKFDSPLLFRHGKGVFLLGRRNVTPSGNYDLGLADLPPLVQRLANELFYWITPKRCALWEVDPGDRTVHFVLDLPSRGDTCFPGLLENGPGSFTVYNYTSPLDGPDLAWLGGQLGPTRIVRTDLTLP